MIDILGFVAFVPWNFGLAEIIGGLTLLATVFGIIFAWRAYRHQVTMIEPWSMTKVSDNLWLLERKAPKLATISGVITGVLCDSYQIHWMNLAGFPTGYFKRGTNILIRIENPTPGAVFELYYEEHRKEKYPFVPEFIHNIKLQDYETYPKTWKKWSTVIY